MKRNIKKLFLQKRKRALKKIIGNFEKPRLSVFRSHKHIYAQLIDDSKGQTLASSSTLDPKVKLNITKMKPQQAAYEVGKELAKKASEKNIAFVAFDRGTRPYHGRIKNIAEGAREIGLIF